MIWGSPLQSLDAQSSLLLHFCWPPRRAQVCFIEEMELCSTEEKRHELQGQEHGDIVRNLSEAFLAIPLSRFGSLASFFFLLQLPWPPKQETFIFLI